MSLLRSGIWTQSWLSCQRGARGAPVQLVAGQSLCIALVGRPLRGPGEGGRDLKRHLGLGAEESSHRARTLHKLTCSSRAVSAARGAGLDPACPKRVSFAAGVCGTFICGEKHL